jgi:hypothetical protein
LPFDVSSGYKGFDRTHYDGRSLVATDGKGPVAVKNWTSEKGDFGSQK